MKQAIVFSIIFILLSITQTRAAVIVGSEKIATSEENLFMHGLHDANLSPDVALSQLNFDMASVLNYVSLKQFLLAKKYINNSQLPQDLKHYFLGIIDLSQGDIDAAENEFSRSNKLKPDTHYASYPLAAIKYEKKLYDQAKALISDFNQTISLNVTSLMLQARIEEKLNNAGAMVETLKRAISLAGEDIEPTASLVKHYFRQGQVEKARSLIEGYINTNPEQREGSLLAISFYLSNDEPAAAIKVLNDWIDRFPRDRIARLQLVETLLNQKQFQQAEQVLAQTMQVFPDDNEFRYLNAILQANIGNIETAKSILVTITSDDEDFLSKEKAKALLLTL